MKQMRWLLFAAAVFVAAPANAAPLPDAPSPLAKVPASAPIVVHLRGVEGVRDRIQAFLEKALPEVAPLFKDFAENYDKNGIDGRKVRGLAKNGPHFLVFLEVPKVGPEPKMALVLTTTKYSDFRDSILKDEERKGLKKENGVEAVPAESGTTTYFVEGPDYAIVTPQKEVAVEFTKKQAGLDRKLSKQQAAALLASDLGVYVNLDPVQKQYADQIKQAKEFMEQALKTAQEGGGGALGPNEKAMIALGGKMIGAAFQAVEDSQGLLYTAQVRPNAVAFHLETELRGGSATSRMLADSRPAAFADLARMPSGQMLYSAYQLPPALTKAAGGLHFALFDTADEKEGTPRQMAIAQLIEAGPGARVDCASLPSPAVRAWQFDNPAKAVEAQLKLLQALNAGDQYEGGVAKEAPKVTARAQKFGDFEMHAVDIEWDLEKSVGGGANLPEEMRKQMAEAMKKLLGEKRRFWFGTDGKLVVQVIAGSWEDGRKLLDRYLRGQGGAGQDEAFREARAEMPAQATSIMLFDPVRYGAIMVEFIKMAAGGAFPFPLNVPADAKPSFIGLGITFQAERASFDFVVTASAVKQGYKNFIAPLRGGG